MKDKYSNLTQETISKLLEDLLPTPIDNIKWRDKIKEGYLYQIGAESGLVAVTGSGGTLEFGESLEKEGASDRFIQNLIAVTTDNGIFNNTIFTKLSGVVWEKR